MQYTYRIVKVAIGGRPTVVDQWQRTGDSSQRCPGFDSRRLPAFTFLDHRLITSKFIYFQHEARCSEHLECEKPLSMDSGPYINGKPAARRGFWYTSGGRGKVTQVGQSD